MEGARSLRHVAVGAASPIYASRNGPMAAEFARAVSGWYWSPEAAKNIPTLFRLVTRVELRCSNTSEHPDGLDGMLRADFNGWMSEHHVVRYSGGVGDAPSLARAKLELARRRNAGPELDRVPVLVALAGSPLAAPAERHQWYAEQREILGRAAAPIGVLTHLDIQSYESPPHRRADTNSYRSFLRSVLARPEVASDPHVAGVLRLKIAERSYWSASPVDAETLLTATATDAALTAQDPLKVGALVRLASLQAANGDLAAARDSYNKTGLTAQQCTFVDASPKMRKSGAASVDFPEDALQWGFEGWVVVEMDILADGSTTNRRAVVAYPPLIFRDAAVEAMKHTLYDQSYRPEGGLGCGGKQTKVNFLTTHLK